jgi:GT2 family glycosyltransferase
LLLDDASSDAAVQPLLRSWLGRAGPAWRLEMQVKNIGFVGTVNRGMEMTSGNVILLNSDTLVTPGWYERLQICLNSDLSIATATPWTNNGEIASLGGMCLNKQVPENPDFVAKVIQSAGPAVYPEIPTAVGFCVAISRRAIDQLGVFDQDLFGLGYGEENDFSMRAREAGLRNVLCDDVFVAHVGGRSFEPRGMRPDEGSMNRLLSRHPTYQDIIHQFITSDPLANRRNQLLTALHEEGVEW